MSPITIPIRTLTPIWTGDIDGNANRLCLSGLMGSLRWWWEVLERGVNAQIANIDKQAEDDPVGNRFGATGKRRAFRLVLHDEAQDVRRSAIQQRVRIPESERGWYFKSNAFFGTFKLDVVPLRLDFNPNFVRELLSFISRYGALGARSQMGFGVIEPIKPTSVVTADFLKNDIHYGKADRLIDDQGMPALHNMFFAEISPKRDVKEETTFQLKAAIRNLYRSDDELRHYLCGYIFGNERMGSKISVSRWFEFEQKKRIRIWGWVPRNGPQEKKRGLAIQQLYDFLKTHPDFHLSSWREVGSDRDTKEKVVKGGPLVFYLKLMGFMK